MKESLAESQPRRAGRWGLIVAFGLVYVSWGTTYLAIKVGVRYLPPALFGGVRYILAGLVVFGFLAWRRESLRLPRDEWLWVAVSSLFLFVGGNGLINLAEKSVDSGVASVLVATTPLWLALLETVWPSGERLSARGWLGLLIGLGGVLVLLAPRLRDPALFFRDAGPFLVLGSASSWAVGSFILRYQRRRTSPLTVAAFQMVLGGTGLSLIGIAVGELGRLTPESFTVEAVGAFLYLLVIGSLVGFVAYTWLLARVSATLAGTYAYVNPAVAILVGGALGHERITGWLIAGMVIILSGVTLVRRGGLHGQVVEEAEETPGDENVPAPANAGSLRSPGPDG